MIPIDKKELEKDLAFMWEKFISTHTGKTCLSIGNSATTSIEFAKFYIMVKSGGYQEKD